MSSNQLPKLHTPAGTDRLPLPVIPDPRFHPSPAKRVLFSDGQIVRINRRTRRRLGLYGSRVREVKH